VASKSTANNLRYNDSHSYQAPVTSLEDPAAETPDLLQRSGALTEEM
jgi:hypothetical protein